MGKEKTGSHLMVKEVDENMSMFLWSCKLVYTIVNLIFSSIWGNWINKEQILISLFKIVFLEMYIFLCSPPFLSTQLLSSPMIPMLPIQSLISVGAMAQELVVPTTDNLTGVG